MAQVKMQKPWVEIHLRIPEGRPEDFSGVRYEDYAMHGNAIPWGELCCVSDVYGMFRTIPRGFKEWFPRPVTMFDMLVLCRPIAGRRPLAHPLLIIPEIDADRFLSHDIPVTRPKVFKDGEHHTLKGVLLVGCQNHWSSRWGQDTP